MERRAWIKEAVLTKMCKMQMKRVREVTVRARATQREHVLDGGGRWGLGGGE